MKAIVIATGCMKEDSAISERIPAPLLWMIDRPFIQFIVENLVSQGITEFEFVLSHAPQKIESFLGDGERWGCQFRYHLVKYPRQPYDALRFIKHDEHEDYLLLHADRFPEIDLNNEENQLNELSGLLFCLDQASGSPKSTHSHWTGWAILKGGQLSSIPADINEEGLLAHLGALDQKHLSVRNIQNCLSIQTYNDFLQSNQQILQKKFRNCSLSGQEIEQGIWLSRNVVMHPTVKLTPPVYIAEDCRIEKGAQLGPHAVIGKQSVIDCKSQIKDAVVFPGSYVGHSLEIDNSIVDKNCLINLNIGTPLIVTDKFVLASLHENKFHASLMKIISQSIGLFCFILALPILCFTALYLKLAKGRYAYWKNAVYLPASPDPNQWNKVRLLRFSDEEPSSIMADFLLRVLPGLYNIAKGEIAFVGLPPRENGEIEQLNSDWRSLYLESKAGLITESLVFYGRDINADEQYSTEMFYSVSSGLKHDCFLVWKYLLRVIKRQKI